MNKLIVLIVLAFLVSCKSQVADTKNTPNPNDFSNKSYTQNYNEYLTSLAKEEQLKTTKVVYKEKVYEFDEFKNNIGFDENISINSP